MIPDNLSHLKLNHCLVTQLDISFQYAQNSKKLENNIEVIRSLSDDIKHQDVIRWFLPNYRNLITILSLDVELKEKESVRWLYICFQSLIVSYCCFQIKPFQSDSKLIVETLIGKFISNDLLNIKQRNTKVVQQYVKTGEPFAEKFNIRKMLKLHCKTVSSILNLHIKMLTASFLKENYILQFFLVVGRICFIIESLTYCLLSQASSAIPEKDGGKYAAYSRLHSQRGGEFDFQYTKDILFILRKRTEDVEERVGLLKVMITELLRIFNQVTWSHLDEYVKKNPVHRTSMIKRRLYIQASLLVVGDLNLISELRLTQWPKWSKID